MIAGVLVLFIVPFLFMGAAYGHGIGYELLPAVQFGEKMASLEITSMQHEENDRKITFTLIDEKEKTIPATYNVSTYKQGMFISRTELTSNGDSFTLIIESPKGEEVIRAPDMTKSFEEISQALDGAGALIGPSYEGFELGGLYEFDVIVSDMENTAQYKVNLSIPYTIPFEAYDPDFGAHEAMATSYYDVITVPEYERGAFTFDMPFEWDELDTGDIPLIHAEVSIPKKLGSALSARYATYVNGIILSERATTIDDYVANERTIHVIVDRDDLKRITVDTDTLEFSIEPESALPKSIITENAEYRITISWEPPGIIGGESAAFYFNITDVFLQNTPVNAEYEVYLERGHSVASSSGKGAGVLNAIMPEGAGPAVLRFEGIGGNALARAELPIAVSNPAAPGWLRDTAGWWAAERISDDDFSAALEYLVQRGLINPDERAEINVTEAAAGWYAGTVTAAEFAGTISQILPERIP